MNKTDKEKTKEGTEETRARNALSFLTKTSRLTHCGKNEEQLEIKGHTIEKKSEREKESLFAEGERGL